MLCYAEVWALSWKFALGLFRKFSFFLLFHLQLSFIFFSWKFSGLQGRRWAGGRSGLCCTGHHLIRKVPDLSTFDAVLVAKPVLVLLRIVPPACPQPPPVWLLCLVTSNHLLVTYWFVLFFWLPIKLIGYKLLKYWLFCVYRENCLNVILNYIYQICAWLSMLANGF